MLYLIAVLIPPLAVLLCGKPFQAMVNGLFWVVGLLAAVVAVGFPVIVVCIVHAIGVVHNYYADQRAQRFTRHA
jgi:hypothetical protein